MDSVLKQQARKKAEFFQNVSDLQVSLTDEQRQQMSQRMQEQIAEQQERYRRQLAEDDVTAHMRNTKLRSVRDAVLAHMPHAYDGMIAKYREGNSQLQLITPHQERGKSFTLDGEKVLRINLAGSGFQQWRKDYRGYKGTGGGTGQGDRIIEEYRREQEQISKIRWYHGLKLFNWLGVRTPEQVQLDNDAHAQRAEELKQKIEAVYGSQLHWTVDGQTRVFEHIRKKVKQNKLTYTLAGPLGLGGVLNTGDYSIERLQQYSLQIAREQLRKLSDQLDGGDDGRDIHIMLKGHSRGGVAASTAAVKIKEMADQEFPELAHRLRFDLTQFDPVPGPDGSLLGAAENSRIDLRNRLGDNAETTVFYSMHTDHNVFFKPQHVQGAKRVILLPTKHSAGLDEIDVINKDRKLGDRITYRDASTGEAYRGSGIHELPPGLYISDGNHNLVRFDSAETALGVYNDVVKDTSWQGDRHDVIRDVIRTYFDDKAASNAPGGEA